MTGVAKESMGASTHRVVQWATGNTGQRAFREVIRDPVLELVGMLVCDPAKDGVDAGKCAVSLPPESSLPPTATCHEAPS
jgi:2,4-diaminopentanoate dehydrogenase